MESGVDDLHATDDPATPAAATPASNRHLPFADQPRAPVGFAVALALLVHGALLMVPLPTPREELSRPAPTLSLDLVQIRPDPLPVVMEPSAMDTPPVRETPPIAALVPAPAPPPVASIPLREPPEAPAPAPTAPRILAPDGRLRLAPFDDWIATEPVDRAPERQYQNVVSLYPAPPIRYAPTAFAEVYAPDGNAGQVAAFHYPVLKVLYIFPQLSWLILPPPPMRRDCLRHAGDLYTGTCVDAGETPWQRLVRRTQEH